MKHLDWLSQISPSEQSLVGEKVFLLSQLIRQGYPILPGYAIGAPILKEFLENIQDTQSLIANLPSSSLHLNVDDYLILQSVAQKSRQIILETPFPTQWQEDIVAAATQLNVETLIVRPSLIIPPSQSVTSGLKRSLYASVAPKAHCCWCQPEALTKTIKKVWAELFGAKSLFYWQKLGVEIEKINLAVLVQPLRDATVSGIIEIRPDRLFISANFGLGHSILRGEIQPDFYEIERSSSTIINRQLGSKAIAYRIQKLHLDREDGEDCLEVYLTSEEEQQQFALDDEVLDSLIQLTEDLVQKKTQIDYLEWTLPQNSVEPLYFTQVNYSSFLSRKINNQHLQDVQDEISPSLTGIAAASGSITASVQIVMDSSIVPTIKPGSIVVLKQLAPHQISLLKQAGGIITEQGGLTSHGAILARELGIPAIVGLTYATDILQTGDRILLNGDTGKIERLSAEEKFMVSNRQQQEIGSDFSQKHNLKYSPNYGDRFLLERYPIATQLMVNLSQADLIDGAIDLPVDGVGLIRAELMLADAITEETLLDRSLFSDLLNQIVNRLGKFVSAFSPRPVFYRSLDYCFWLKQTEVNPVVSSKRGTYNYLSDATLFKLELSAIAQLYQQGQTNCHLILPFVRSVAEVRYCRRLLEEVGLTEQPNFQLWMMAEIPSVMFLIEEYVQAGIQGITIGTNDLTQLFLGIDREQPFATAGLSANHPVIFKAIAHLVKAARQAGIPCSICGQAPVLYPQLVDQLIRLGITTISVEAEAVNATYNAIARAEHRLCLEVARQSLNLNN